MLRCSGTPPHADDCICSRLTCIVGRTRLRLPAPQLLVLVQPDSLPCRPNCPQGCTGREALASCASGALHPVQRPATPPVLHRNLRLPGGALWKSRTTWACVCARSLPTLPSCTSTPGCCRVRQGCRPRSPEQQLRLKLACQIFAWHVLQGMPRLTLTVCLPGPARESAADGTARLHWRAMLIHCGTRLLLWLHLQPPQGTGSLCLVTCSSASGYSSQLGPAGYATNSAFLNHCIIAFWKRLAAPGGLNLEPMLYQVLPL